uniref:Uncharacterized protein n=1 Tax=Timema bartmani TaxID=61472 RepID=A0A7R9ETR2_9NEOP|nr:unnamed protein product [Timema bartmani]
MDIEVNKQSHEAGKLALNLTQENIQNLVQNAVPITSPKTTAIPVNKRKVITIRASQLYSMDGRKAPNILKRVDGNSNLSGTFPSNVMLTSARTVSSPALLRNNFKAESVMDMWIRCSLGAIRTTATGNSLFMLQLVEYCSKTQPRVSNIQDKLELPRNLKWSGKKQE